MLLTGVARFVNPCEPIFKPPVIVPPAFGNAALAVVCAADAADEAEETPVSTYPFVAASAVLFGAARLLNACEPIFKPPVIVPPAFGNAALAVVCAALASETACVAVVCAAVAADEAELAVVCAAVAVVEAEFAVVCAAVAVVEAELAVVCAAVAVVEAEFAAVCAAVAVV